MPAAGRASPGAASAGQIGFTILGQPGPQGAAVDPATGTLYVLSAPSQNAHGAVDVLNALACDAQHASGCLGTTPSDDGILLPLQLPSEAIGVYDTQTAALTVMPGAALSNAEWETWVARRKPPPRSHGRPGSDHQSGPSGDQVAYWKPGNTRLRVATVRNPSEHSMMEVSEAA
jgi:hypothetical protein